MADGERRKPVDIEVCRTKVKVTTSKNKAKMLYLFISARYFKNKMKDINATVYTYA